jgi:hypothetical protein
MNKLDITIGNKEINTFLKDFEKNSQTEILSGAKKDEIVEIAKAKGILIKDSVDLAGIKVVYIFPDEANKNKERIPKNELLRRLPTLIGKPINLEHIRRNVVGYYIDYRYIEKENKVIAYGIIFKNVFEPEWKEMQKLFKQGKLTTSYEIWRDTRKDEQLPDGTWLYHDLEVAGGAILMKEEPAFDGCRVLAMAKKNLESQRELIYASVNKDVPRCFGNCNECNKCKNRGLIKAEQTSTISPQIQKIVCENCGHNFEYTFTAGTTNEIKCQNCFAILDLNGKMRYPPQIKDFHVSCSNCQSRNNWLILGKDNNYTKIKCLSCSSEYRIKFKNESINLKYVEMLTALKEISVSCIQCGTRNKRYLPSTQKIINVKCKKCGINFDFDTSHKVIKEIESIEKIEKSLKEDKKMKDSVLIESKLEFDEKEIDNFDKDTIGLADAKKISYEEKKNLPDSSFAVVVTVKNKKTGKPRKIRKYPIHDEAHVRNALARLAQKAPREELARLGISVKSVIRKVLRRARELGMKGLLKRRGLKGSAVKNFLNKQILRKAVSKIRKIKKDFELLKKEAEITKANLENLKVKREKYSKGIKKFANQIKQLKSKAKSLEVTVSSLKKEVEDTKHFYLTNAKKVLERRNELGDFAKDLKDKDLIDDTKYELTKAKKIIAEKEAEKKKIELKTASLIVGDKEKEDQWAKNREIVNQKAFGHLYKKEKKIG